MTADDIRTTQDVLDKLVAAIKLRGLVPDGPPRQPWLTLPNTSDGPDGPPIDPAPPRPYPKDDLPF